MTLPRMPMPRTSKPGRAQWFSSSMPPCLAGAHPCSRIAGDACDARPSGRNNRRAASMCRQSGVKGLLPSVQPFGWTASPLRVKTATNNKKPGATAGLLHCCSGIFLVGNDPGWSESSKDSISQVLSGCSSNVRDRVQTGISSVDGRRTRYSRRCRRRSVPDRRPD
jgi:hypothetical protein